MYIYIKLVWRIVLNGAGGEKPATPSPLERFMLVIYKMITELHGKSSLRW